MVREVRKFLNRVAKNITPHNRLELCTDGRQLVEGASNLDFTPKFISNAIDVTTDANIVNRVTEIRGALTSAYKGSGNFGFADTNISGISRKEFYAHSSIDSETFTGDLLTKVPDISLEPTNPVFEALKVDPNNVVDDVNGYLRIWDSEYKIINDIANQLGDNFGDSGTIKLFTDRPPCPSCTNVINQFMDMYPNITVEVLHNNGAILK